MLFPTITLLVLFCLHSITAANFCKNFFSLHFGLGGKNYRLFYNFFSLVTFGFWYHIFIVNSNQEPVYEFPTSYAFAFRALQIACVFGIFLTLKDFSGRQFLGLEEEKNEFTAKGMFKLCRHPLYFFFTIFLLCSVSQTLNKLIFSYGSIFYFYFGSLLEEERLVSVIGEKYKNYQKTVPHFFPFTKIGLRQ
ncbi:DUF1295 domain-containing protein [bacterium]|nr:DUF1295 domain-containing protein [bacterium]